MSTSEYWKGENTNYKSVWENYKSGLDLGYVEKLRTMRFHLLRIKLGNPPISLPLYNFEAVYKTVKGYYHDIKKNCFSGEEYREYGPLFLYDIDRSSCILDFLGDMIPLIVLGWALKNQLVLGQSIKNQDEKLNLIKKHFPNVKFPDNVLNNFFKAETSSGLDEAVSMMYKQTIEEVKISQEILDSNNPAKTKKTLKDL